MRQPDEREIHASIALTASGQTAIECDISHASDVEVWISCSAVAGAGDFTFNAQTGLATAVLATGTDWKTQKTVANITAAGTYAMTMSRRTENLGRRLRVNWVRNSGTSVTVSIRVIIREEA